MGKDAVELQHAIKLLIKEVTGCKFKVWINQIDCEAFYTSHLAFVDAVIGCMG